EERSRYPAERGRGGRATSSRLYRQHFEIVLRGWVEEFRRHRHTRGRRREADVEQTKGILALDDDLVAGNLNSWWTRNGLPHDDGVVRVHHCALSRSDDDRCIRNRVRECRRAHQSVSLQRSG